MAKLFNGRPYVKSKQCHVLRGNENELEFVYPEEHQQVVNPSARLVRTLDH
jgi:hypothetical protein